MMLLRFARRLPFFPPRASAPRGATALFTPYAVPAVPLTLDAEVGLGNLYPRSRGMRFPIPSLQLLAHRRGDIGDKGGRSIANTKYSRSLPPDNKHLSPWYPDITDAGLSLSTLVHRFTAFKFEENPDDGKTAGSRN